MVPPLLFLPVSDPPMGVLMRPHLKSKFLAIIAVGPAGSGSSKPRSAVTAAGPVGAPKAGRLSPPAAHSFFGSCGVASATMRMTW